MVRAVAGLIICLMLTGCMHRRLIVESQPPGALVLLEGREIGYTPVAVDFTYYGTREITLVKEGYETLTVMQPISAPWYQHPPLDFISDNFLFHHRTDRYCFTYQMQPTRIVPTQELLDRAEGLRGEAHVAP